MTKDNISTNAKVEQLRYELYQHHNNPAYLQCNTMGEIVLKNIKLVVQKEFTQSIIGI
jgi:hypothetical protein